jgi:hypothetical protein
VLGVVLVSGAAVAYMVLGPTTNTSNTNSTANTSNENTNTVVQVARAVDGVLVAPGEEQPELLAVMIENSSDARPQSGLDKASVVYEALAEGGITRYMAIVPKTTDVKEFGPVRSARPYFVSFAGAYHPLYVHAGGSPQALAMLAKASSNVVDLNLLSRGAYGWRDTKRYAPHNLYTNPEKLRSAITDLKKDVTASVTSWTYKTEAEAAERPVDAKPITINYSSLAYRSMFLYDATTNTYQRKVGTTIDVTRDGKQITAKNVVVMYVPTTLYPNETKRLKMSTVGKGKAIVFRDGVAVVGTWKKASDKDREVFLDCTGAPIQLNPGMTWVSVIPVDRLVTY